MLVVFPVPGGPERMRLGMLPSRAMTWRRTTASELPTTSSTRVGRYFSTQGMS
uniref:Pco108913 n=1 Tax=Arundo donax TaxID=35708 RepID=A0A0A9EDF2_ARUDO